MKDNYDIWLAQDEANERWRESRPICAFCHEHIQDEHKYEVQKITGMVVLCEQCAEEYANELAEEYKDELLCGWRKDNDD